MKEQLTIRQQFEKEKGKHGDSIYIKWLESKLSRIGEITDEEIEDMFILSPTYLMSEALARANKTVGAKALLNKLKQDK